MNLLKIQQKHAHAERTWNATATSDICLSVTLLREAARTVMTPFLLPELQSELGLSAQQVTQIRQLKQEMLTKEKDFSSQVAAKRKELDALLAPGASKGEQVKKLF